MIVGPRLVELPGRTPTDVLGPGPPRLVGTLDVAEGTLDVAEGTVDVAEGLLLPPKLALLGGDGAGPVPPRGTVTGDEAGGALEPVVVAGLLLVGAGVGGGPAAEHTWSNGTLVGASPFPHFQLSVSPSRTSVWPAPTGEYVPWWKYAQ